MRRCFVEVVSSLSSSLAAAAAASRSFQTSILPAARTVRLFWLHVSRWRHHVVSELRPHRDEQVEAAVEAVGGGEAFVVQCLPLVCVWLKRAQLQVFVVMQMSTKSIDSSCSWNTVISSICNTKYVKFMGRERPYHRVYPNTSRPYVHPQAQCSNYIHVIKNINVKQNRYYTSQVQHFQEYCQKGVTMQKR